MAVDRSGQLATALQRLIANASTSGVGLDTTQIATAVNEYLSADEKLQSRLDLESPTNGIFKRFED